MSTNTTAYPTDYRGWLAKLISFDTVSRNPNRPLIHYVRDYLQSVGVTDIVLVADPKRDTHVNLFATLPGEGGVKQGGIVLSGHSDVVPVDGQKWDSDPFTMVEKDGKLYGRGACDMKCFLAVTMALVPTILKMKRAKPVHIAFSYDEEMGCTGIPTLIDYLKQKNFKADACLVGEPSGLVVSTGCKGYATWEVKVKGKAIHSSMALMNTSVNAIEYAAQIVCKIRQIAIELRDHGPRYKDYKCPFSCITVGMIKGGIAVNTVPAECAFIFNVRLADTKVADDIESRVRAYIAQVILPNMKKEAPEADVTLVRTAGIPAFNGSEDNTLTKICRKLANDYGIHKADGSNEAGFFQEGLGIPTVVVGPKGERAHMANEFVYADSMEKSMKFTTDLIKIYTSSAASSKL